MRLTIDSLVKQASVVGSAAQEFLQMALQHADNPKFMAALNPLEHAQVLKAKNMYGALGGIPLPGMPAASAQIARSAGSLGKMAGVALALKEAGLDIWNPQTGAVMADGLASRIGAAGSTMAAAAPKPKFTMEMLQAAKKQLAAGGSGAVKAPMAGAANLLKKTL